jgi:hypothetical protein
MITVEVELTELEETLLRWLVDHPLEVASQAEVIRQATGDLLHQRPRYWNYGEANAAMRFLRRCGLVQEVAPTGGMSLVLAATCYRGGDFPNARSTISERRRVVA